MSRRICVIDGCEKVRFGHGWCQMHYTRWRNNGDPMVVKPRRTGPDNHNWLGDNRPTCSVDGCNDGATGRGMCNPHYQRWYRHGDPLGVPEPRPRTLRLCSMSGCNKSHKARGLCDMHYTRLLDHGDPAVVLPPPRISGLDHHMWRGDNVGYSSLHARIGRERGRARAHWCVDCGVRAYEWSLSWARVPDERIRWERWGPTKAMLPFSTDVYDYDPRCRSCHRIYDREEQSA